MHVPCPRPASPVTWLQSATKQGLTTAPPTREQRAHGLSPQSPLRSRNRRTRASLTLPRQVGRRLLLYSSPRWSGDPVGGNPASAPDRGLLPVVLLPTYWCAELWFDPAGAGPAASARAIDWATVDFLSAGLAALALLAAGYF